MQTYHSHTRRLTTSRVMRLMVWLLLMSGYCYLIDYTSSHHDIIRMAEAQSASYSYSIEIDAVSPGEAMGLPDGVTAMSTIEASALLGSSTPALLWGFIPAASVNTICNQLVDTGVNGFSASISYQGSTFPRNMQVTATGGCDAAGPYSPDGVEAVLVDDDGRNSALICPSNSEYYHCTLYDISDDVATLWESMISSTTDSTAIRLSNLGSNKRKLLDNCISRGFGKGFIFGTIAGIIFGGLICLPTVENPVAFGFCTAAQAGAIAARGSVIGVAVTCTSDAISCFPGDALVTTSLGISKPMQRLMIGEQVAVHTTNGEVAYSDLYAFGHEDPNTISPFVQIMLVPKDTLVQNLTDVPRKVLKLSPGHFSPILNQERSQNNIYYKRASDINVGDFMLGILENDKETKKTSVYIVEDVSITMERGKYNPLTLTGDIIVDGIVSSCHSEWFLDELFDAIGFSQWLPIAYQILLSPIRILYVIAGKDAYKMVYNRVDDSIGVLTVAKLYVGGIKVITLIVGMSFAILLVPWKYNLILGTKAKRVT